MIPEALLKIIGKGQCVPFVGAGFSLNAYQRNGEEMLNWNRLTKELSSDLGCTSEEDNLVIITKYEKTLGRPALIERIRELLLNGHPEPSDVHKMFARITSFNIIYTTNFDFLIEDAFRAISQNVIQESVNRHYKTIVGEKALALLGGPDTVNIIKMHGDLSHEEHMIITKPDYDEFLNRSPMLATHLASTLITKTALFIGYSLRDSNFNHIKRIIRNRLGNLERKSYYVGFDLDAKTIELYENENLFVINLITNNKDKSAILLEFFTKIYEYTTFKSAEKTQSAIMRDDNLRNQSLLDVVKQNNLKILEKLSNLCFVLMSSNRLSNRVYDIIKNAVGYYNIGLAGMHEIIDLTTDNDFRTDIRTTIVQSKFVICDLTNKNDTVLYYLGIAMENNKKIILLTQDSYFPYDTTNLFYIQYQNTDDGINRLYHDLKRLIEGMLYVDPIEEAKNLLNQGYFNAAIVTIFSSLEFALKNLLSKKYDIPATNQNFSYLLYKLYEEAEISKEEKSKLEIWRSVRNNAVHAGHASNYKEAEEIISGVEGIISNIKLSNGSEID